MLYIVRTGSLLEELPNGYRAELRGHDLVCFDLAGREVKRLDRDTVMMWSRDEKLKGLLGKSAARV
jgi:hypothetical protein